MLLIIGHKNGSKLGLKLDHFRDHRSVVFSASNPDGQVREWGITGQMMGVAAKDGNLLVGMRTGQFQKYLSQGQIDEMRRECRF